MEEALIVFVFEKAPTGTTLGALNEIYDNPIELRTVIEATIDKNQKQLEKLSSPKPTGNIQKDIANKQKAKAESETLTAKIAYWNSVLSAMPATKEDITRQLTGEDSVVLPESVESDNDRLQYVAENSIDLSEITNAYNEAMRTAEVEGLSEWQEYLLHLTINKNSFIRYADRKHINGTIARSWFNRKENETPGAAIDVIAERLGVTPQDVVDFILEHPGKNVKKGNSLTKALNDRFRTVATEMAGQPVGGIESASGKLLMKALEIGSDTGRREAMANSPLAEVPNVFVDFIETADINLEDFTTFEEPENAIQEVEGDLWQFSDEDYREIKNFINHAKQSETYARTTERVEEARNQRAAIENATEQEYPSEGQSKKRGIGEEILPQSVDNADNNTNFVENNQEDEQRDEVSEQISQEELGSSDEIRSRLEEASIFIGRSLDAASEEQPGLSRHQREDLEKQAAFDYAKANNLWIDDLYSLGVPFAGGGNENTLAYDDANKIIYKSNNLFNSRNSVLALLEGIRIHNELFPETKYELVGFTGFENGNNRTPYVEVVLRQDYIPNATQATPEEIADYMQSIGFERVKDDTFTNGSFTVSDLRPRNVLKNEEGNIFVVDDIVSENQEVDIPEFNGNILEFALTLSKKLVMLIYPTTKKDGRV